METAQKTTDLLTATHKTYEAVLGLEVHVQLKTKSKLFCACAISFGAEPNTNTCPVCLGLPGALPVLNEKAVDFAILVGLALNCEINDVAQFDRKQYFYPDLPKGYQISQLAAPVCKAGSITLNSGKPIRINRAHLEEDAGKLVHSGADGLAGSDYSLVDLNRAGTALLEIVTEPDFSTSEEARDYMVQLRNIVRYLGVCDGNLEEGSMRCDANVSIRKRGSKELGTKAEIKNMNSFRSIQRAIEVEFLRQVELVESGGAVAQETRLWNEATGTTVSMRSKEAAHDYRYFPDPDLRPLIIPPEKIAALKSTMSDLPAQRLEKLTGIFGLNDYDATILVDHKDLGDYFLEAANTCQNYKALVNWLTGDISGYLHTEHKTLEQTQLSPQALSNLVILVDDNTISSKIAKQLLPELLEKGGDPKQLVADKGMAQVSDTGALQELVNKVIAENPKETESYQGGKTQLMGFFVGQVMKLSQGKANPKTVNQLLKKTLES